MVTNRRFWDRGKDQAPIVTGAASVMDCSDLVDALRGLGISVPLEGRTLDVGCGTGRFAKCCDVSYRGVDLSPSQVAYAKERGVFATVIDGPRDLPEGPADWIVCFSVFTHIDVPERVAYLDAFTERASADTTLIVDIIPGDGRGDVARWTADPVEFEALLLLSGWTAEASYERVAPGGNTHRYYRCSLQPSR